LTEKEESCHFFSWMVNAGGQHTFIVGTIKTPCSEQGVILMDYTLASMFLIMSWSLSFILLPSNASASCIAVKAYFTVL
jgi:hypothetical protein